MNTDDESFRRNYFTLATRALKSNEQIELTSDDLAVIEYYLKDVSRHPVSANASRQDCGRFFQLRVDYLKQGDQEEWTDFSQAITSNAEIIGGKSVQELYTLRKAYTTDPVPI